MTAPTHTTASGGFQLDTSGAVPLHPHDGPDSYLAVWWSDLSPFEQGYIEALFASLYDPVFLKPVLRSGPADFRGVAFRHLSPSALERIRKDCGAGQRAGAADYHRDQTLGRAGAAFWRARQRGGLTFRGFPPLHVYLSEDGFVNLKERV